MSNLNDKILSDNKAKLEEAQKIVGASTGNNGDGAKDDSGQIDIEKMEIELPDGEKVSLKELKNGFLRQADYTKKTMALSDEKKQYEKEWMEAETYIGATQTWFKENPDEYTKFHDYFKEPDGSTPNIVDKSKQKQAEPKKEEKVMPIRNPEVDNQLKANKKEIEELKRQQEAEKVDKAIDEVQTENKLDKEEMTLVINLANGMFDPKKTYIENLTDAYKLLKVQFDKNKKTLEEQQKEKIGAKFLGGASRSLSNQKSESEKVGDALWGENGAEDFL